MEFKTEEELFRGCHEVLVNYFMALQGDSESLIYLLTHPEPQLRELGKMMKERQAAQPQRQLEDGYALDSSNDSQE
jgi:hypothetical protein